IRSARSSRRADSHLDDKRPPDPIRGPFPCPGRPHRRYADATATSDWAVRLTRVQAEGWPMTTRSPDDAFLDIVAHELRTPVTSIYAAAYVLARDRLEADDRRAVAAALVIEVERLYRLIEDLVVYGRA